MDATVVAPSARTAAPEAPANPIVLTAKAVEMIKDTMVREGMQDHGIRVGVIGGGCSGFQYSMDFEKESRPDDFTIDQDGVKLYVDPMSHMYLQGVTIDYVVGLQGAGFKFENPNAKSTCGCGSSFTP
jgi:iron-sulfur cluster assembly accessory protein